MKKAIQIEKKQRLFIAPCSSMTKAFKKFLDEHFEYEFLGYLDTSKSDDNIHQVDTIDGIAYDAIYIISPNYAPQIFKEYRSKNIPKNKIKFATFQDGFVETSLFLLSIQKYLDISYLKLLQLRAKHKNTRAFIVANGPNLQIKDLEKIQNEITFACNKIYLAFEQTKWRPSYYFVTDGLVYKQNYEKINELQLIKLFSTQMLTLAKKMKNAIYFPLSYKQPARFATNALSQLYSGSTVTYVMLEFAVYMGIKEIYIIGLDFSFELPQKEVSKELSCEGEVNHFHKEYRKVGEKWTMPDMDHQRHSFLEAKKFCDTHGIKIYNASRESKLDVFERVDFESLFISDVSTQSSCEFPLP